MKNQVNVLASGVPVASTSTDWNARPQVRHASRGATYVPSLGPGRPRLLWIGDAAAQTGFATVTHSVLKHLHAEWDVVVSGINYHGQPHDYPYTIQPARRRSDLWGIDDFANLCQELQPAVVLINNDWWNVARFMDCVPQCPVIAYMPVDGKNLSADSVDRLNLLDTAIWYTDFGRLEAEQAGYAGVSCVIPHGVDHRLYEPLSRQLARRQLGLRLAPDAFVVGNVNRNQPRKRLDLTLQYFAEWVERFAITNAYLCLHCAQEDIGWDLSQLANYFGIAERVVFSGPASLGQEFPLANMPLVYNAFDVQVTTTAGEGWGLTTMEGMMCGVPQIVPHWSALAEWPQHVAAIPCSTQLVNPGLNTVGGVPDKEVFIQTLHALYSHPRRRRQLGERGREHVSQSCFRWDAVAARFHAVFQQAVQRQALLN